MVVKVDDFSGSLFSQCPSISGILVWVRTDLEGGAVTVQETCDLPCDLPCDPSVTVPETHPASTLADWTHHKWWV